MKSQCINRISTLAAFDQWLTHAAWQAHFYQCAPWRRPGGHDACPECVALWDVYQSAVAVCRVAEAVGRAVNRANDERTRTSCAACCGTGFHVLPGTMPHIALGDRCPVCQGTSRRIGGAPGYPMHDGSAKAALEHAIRAAIQSATTPPTTKATR